MTNGEFEKTIKRLDAYFKPKSRPDEYTMNEYKKALACVPDNRVKEFYSDVVSRFQFFPKIAELRSLAESYISEKRRKENDNYCFFCLNTGIVRYFKKGFQPFPDHEYEHFAHCPACAAGSFYASSFPSARAVLQDGELEYLYSEHFKKYGSIEKQEGKKAKQYVTTFVKAFGRSA